MKKVATLFPEVWILEPRVFRDGRGFFLESYSAAKLADVYGGTFRQDNHSRSVRGTVRGLHFTARPGQVKLVRCTRGKVWDVVVDIRPGSPTFKEWVGVELSAENFRQLFIPVGFAHGFAVLSEVADFQYKVNNYYNPDLEREIRWDDPAIGVDWKVTDPVLSKRDQASPTLAEYLAAHPDPFEP